MVDDRLRPKVMTQRSVNLRSVVLVDGGYFDNSWPQRTRELLAMLGAWAVGGTTDYSNVMPEVVHYSNSPVEACLGPGKAHEGCFSAWTRGTRNACRWNEL